MLNPLTNKFLTMKHIPMKTSDKMPANYFYLGLIHLALPHAKIIHSMRDPMDSCFSCYSRLFNDTMEFAYDQATLGRYYVRYMTLMQHWYGVLPAGRILDLRYEDMVADTENQSRRLSSQRSARHRADCASTHAQSAARPPELIWRQGWSCQCRPCP